MNTKLFISAITKFSLGVIIVALLIFLPAGTIYFTNGWLFIGVLFIPMFFAGIVMLIKSPELLKKRLDAKEKHSKQSIIIKLSGLMFIAGFIYSRTRIPIQLVYGAELHRYRSLCYLYCFLYYLCRGAS